MERRRFLRTAGLLALAAGAGATGWLIRPRSRVEVLAYPDLLLVLGDADRVRSIGEAYRRAVPDEATPDDLARMILRRSGLAAYRSDDALRDHLAARVRRDFVRGETVQLDGWVLSRTEARQSALFSILHP